MNRKEIQEYVDLLNSYVKLMHDVEIVGYQVIYKKFIQLELVKGNIGKYYNIAITDAYTQLVGLRRFSKVLKICSIF